MTVRSDGVLDPLVDGDFALLADSAVALRLDFLGDHGKRAKKTISDY